MKNLLQTIYDGGIKTWVLYTTQSLWFYRPWLRKDKSGGGQSEVGQGPIYDGLQLDVLQRGRVVMHVEELDKHKFSYVIVMMGVSHR